MTNNPPKLSGLWPKKKKKRTQTFTFLNSWVCVYLGSSASGCRKDSSLLCVSLTLKTRGPVGVPFSWKVAGPGTDRHVWCLVKSQRGRGTFTSTPLAKANPMAEVGVRGAPQTLPRTGRKSYSLCVRWLWKQRRCWTTLCVRWLWKQRRCWTLYQKVPPALIGPARPPLASLSGACPSKPKPREGQLKTSTSCGNLGPWGDAGREERLSWTCSPPRLPIRILMWVKAW